MGYGGNNESYIFSSLCLPVCVYILYIYIIMVKGVRGYKKKSAGGRTKGVDMDADVMVAAGKMEGEDEAEVFMKEEEQTMRVEEAIERHVGSLGLSQIVQVVLVSLAWMFDSQNTLITIFTDAQPPEWRCKAEAAAAACSDGGGVCGLPPGTWEWVGGPGSTIVAEWGLICHRKFLAAMPASLFFLGSLLGT